MQPLDYASDAREIFVLPDAVTQIKKLIDDDAATMHDIAEIINFDPALMVQILKIANSALYKFPNKIDSISKAVQVIGTNAVYDLVIAFGICRAFEKLNTNVIDLERFWENSVFCALLNKHFAEKFIRKDAERMFVAGLLHNLGELVMVQFNPEIAEKCSQFNRTETPMKLQMKHLDSTYADVGKTLIQMWGIPENISRPVSKQHYIANQELAIDEQIMQLSYVLALNNCYPEFYPDNANLDPVLLERLSLESEDVELAISTVGMQSLSVLAMFSPASVTIL